MGGARSGLEELEGHAHKLHPEQEPRPHVHSYRLEGGSGQKSKLLKQ